MILPFQISRELKEVGYDKGCSHHHQMSLNESIDPETNKPEGSFGWKKGELTTHSGYFINNWEKSDYSSESWYMCAAPRLHDVQDWLIEKYNIHFYIAPFKNEYSGDVEYIWCIYEKETADNPFKTREEAIEEGMKEIFKYLQV